MIRFFSWQCLAALVHILISNCPAAAAGYPETYICYKTNSGIIMDGNLDDPDWEQTPWTNDFVDIEGDLKPAPLYRTRVKMLWDDTYFYIAAELEEPHVWATYEERDMVIFQENDFEVFIDPDGDTQLYYEIEINAKGTVWDLLMAKPYRDGGPSISSWDIKGLVSAVQLYGKINESRGKDEKWTLEMAFPWKVLRECASPRKIPDNGDQWRINFSRVEWRLDTLDGKYTKTVNPETGKPFPEYNWVWSPQGVINMHQPETWGFVQFSDIPAGTAQTTFSQNPDEDIKWLLRQVYYLEKAFKKETGVYSSSLKEIGADNLKLEKNSFVPELTGEKNTFLCTYVCRERNLIWHIREDGRVWHTVGN